MRRGWDASGVKLGPGEEFEGRGKDYATIEKDLLEKNLFAGFRVQNFISLRPRDGLWIKFKEIE